MRSVSLMSEPAYRFFRIINNKLCSINKKDFMVDKLYTAFKNIEVWLANTWTELDTYSKQTRK